MAYIEGYPGEKIQSVTAKQVGFIVIVAIMMVGLMAYFSKDWRAELPSILTVTTVILAIIGFVSFKVNPGGWRRIFRQSGLEQELAYDRMIADALAELDDSHFIFHDVTFELFHIENLLISPRGIFVIAKIAHGEDLYVKNKVLFAGEHPLDKTTGDIWRVCHLVNIVIKKGFKTEAMPTPILISPGSQTPSVKEYDGITIIPLRKLKGTIEKQKGQEIKEKLVHSFAYYIKKRYP